MWFKDNKKSISWVKSMTIPSCLYKLILALLVHSQLNLILFWNLLCHFPPPPTRQVGGGGDHHHHPWWWSFFSCVVDNGKCNIENVKPTDIKLLTKVTTAGNWCDVLYTLPTLTLILDLLHLFLFCVPQNPQTKVNYEQFSAKNHLLIIHFLQEMMQHATATERERKKQRQVNDLLFYSLWAISWDLLGYNSNSQLL